MKKVLTTLIVALVTLFGVAGTAEAAKPRRDPHVVLAVVDDAPVSLYWSSSVGASAVTLECADGFAAVEATDQFSPINGFVFFDHAGDGSCTAELFAGSRRLASVTV